MIEKSTMQEDPRSSELESLLVRAENVLSPRDTLDTAARLFRNQQIDHIPVVDDGEVVGLCSQNSLGSLLNSEFGHAIYGRTVVAKHMKSDTLVVSCCQSLFEIARLACERPSDTFDDDVIVTDRHGRLLGLVSTYSLAHFQSQEMTRNIADLEARRRELEDANKSLSEMAARLETTNRNLEKARDQSRQAARTKTEFLSVMSHEIRTPLNGTIGMLSLLADTPLNADQKDLLGAANESAESLLLILNDILDFSRLEAGKIRVDESDFEIRLLADSVLTLFLEAQEDRFVELYCDVDTRVPSHITSDAGRIRQILTNLISNAVKFTEEGEIRLRITCRCESEVHDGELLFEVIDSGIGISTADQSRLFQPFVQADSSSSRKSGGTGLGLAISRNLIRALGGDMGVQSVQGDGSVFWFTLPLSKETRERFPYSPPLPEKVFRAIIVTDDESNAQILRNELNLRRIETIHTASVIEFAAHGSIRDEVPIVVFCDSDKLAHLIPFQSRYCQCIEIKGRAREQTSDAPQTRLHLQRPLKASQLDRVLAQLATQPFVLEKEPALDSIQKPNTPVDSKLGKLLLVEDHPINRKLAVRMLEKIGYECDIAIDGLEAWNILKSESYPIILLDCSMPNMDGYELARRIRAVESGDDSIRKTYIIALTAHAMEGDKERCLAAGMNAYLTKPLRRAAIISALEIALRRLPRRPSEPHGQNFSHH